MKKQYIVAYAADLNAAVNPTVSKYCNTEEEANAAAAQGFATNKGAYTYLVYEAKRFVAPVVPKVEFTEITKLLDKDLN